MTNKELLEAIRDSGLFEIKAYIEDDVKVDSDGEEYMDTMYRITVDGNYIYEVNNLFMPFAFMNWLEGYLTDADLLQLDDGVLKKLRNASVAGMKANILLNKLGRGDVE